MSSVIYLLSIITDNIVNSLFIKTSCLRLLKRYSDSEHLFQYPLTVPLNPWPQVTVVQQAIHQPTAQRKASENTEGVARSQRTHKISTNQSS